MDKMMHPALGHEARQRVKSAVEAAESATTAEIVPVVALRCANHANTGLLCGLILLALLWSTELSFGARVRAWASWEVQLGDVAACLALGWLLSHLAWVRRLLLPRRAREHAAHLAAEAAFHRYGLAKALDDNGVLIFVALEERQVVVLAGAGIHALVGDEAWTGVRDRLLERAAMGDLAGGFEAAIAEAGAVLKAHHPGARTAPSQLDDRLRIMHIL
jgi:putative membrane protein